MQPARGESARKRHFQLVAIKRRNGIALLREGGVDGFAINAGDGGDVFGRFEATLDFERGNARLDELGDEIDGGEILRREQVAFFAQIAELAIDDELVGHSARLSAFATVGGALPERFGGEALPRIRDAERAVNEDFERCLRLFGFLEA